MKNKVMKILITLMLLAGMTGIAAANPCPDANGVITASIETALVAPYATGSGNEREYYLTTSFNDGDIKEYCVYPPLSHNLLRSGTNIVDLYSNWDGKIKKEDQIYIDHLEFGPIPSLGSNIDSTTVGTKIAKVTYAPPEGNPQPELFVLHVRSNTICAGSENKDGDNNPETCFVRNGPGPGIPEFPTIALPIAAIIGLVFFFQHKKKKEE